MPTARCSTRSRRTLQRALALLCLAGSAHGATVYRCGNSYQDAPCPQAQVLELDDARSPEQQRERLAATRTEQRLASQLAAERRQREREQAVQRQPLAITGTAPAAPPPAAEDNCLNPHPPARQGARGKGRARAGQAPCPSHPATFVARLPAPKKTGLKAR